MPECALYPVEITFWREIWQVGELKNHTRVLYCKILLGDNRVIVGSSGMHKLLEKVSKVLVALAVDEGMEYE